MALIVIFDEGATPQVVLEVHPSANTPDYTARTDVVINPDLSALTGVPRRYWVHTIGVIAEMSAGQKAIRDAAIAAAADSSLRGAAKACIDGQVADRMILRAIVKLMIDEFNTLRALHSLPDRTLAQAKNAIQNTVDAGDVDE